MSELDDNKALICKFWSAFSESRFDDALGLLSDAATWWVAGTTDISGTYTKPEFRELVMGVSEGTENGIQVTPTLLTAEGERVSMEATSYGLMRDGKEYKNIYHFMHEVRDGRITAVREYMDTEHVTEVFGSDQPG